MGKGGGVETSPPPPIIVQFQKISILSPQKGLEFPGEGEGRGGGWGVL